MTDPSMQSNARSGSLFDDADAGEAKQSQAPKQPERIDQIQLFNANLAELDKQGFKTLEPWQLNIVLEAVNGIVHGVTQPRRDAKPDTGLTAWLSSHDTGLSSKYMAAVMSGAFEPEYAHPYDPSDLGRCIRMLEAVPVLKARMDAMRVCGPYWVWLVDHWGELVKLYDDNKNKVLYERMQAAMERFNARHEEPEGAPGVKGGDKCPAIHISL